MATNFQDISVAWGQNRDGTDVHMEGWWCSVFQDMVPSCDGRALYFLFDDTDEGRRIGPTLVLFDTQMRKFVQKIPLGINEHFGQTKYMYRMADGTIALCTCIRRSRGNELNIHHLTLTPDGLGVGQLRKVFGPIPISEDWIVLQWEQDFVLLTGPGLSVWRVNVNTGQSDSYSVPGGDIRNYYDASILNGIIYIFAAHANDTFDFGRMFIINVAGHEPMRAVATQPDPVAGYPPPREQCAFDVWNTQLFMIGGQAKQEYGQMSRFNDVWRLDLNSHIWERLSLALPIPAIEPRLAVMPNGTAFVWGDCDNPSSCYGQQGNHIHIFQGQLYSQPQPPQYSDATMAGGGAYGGGDAPPPPYPAGGSSGGDPSLNSQGHTYNNEGEAAKIGKEKKDSCCCQ